MGEPENPNQASFSFPPGCQFYPSDEQLVCDYLTHKNNDDHSFGFDVIKEIDFYHYYPFDLPDTACFRYGRGGRKLHWYCYVANARVLNEQVRRGAGGGYWKRKGPLRAVVNAPGAAGELVVGTRKTFVYYLGDSPKNAERTRWVMYEYALVDQKMASFVLCRVFPKSLGRNDISDDASSSCGKESVVTVRRIGVQPTVRHIGVQHDGTIMSVLGESGVHNVSSLHHESKGLKQTRSSGYVGGPSTADSLTAEQLKAILEEDYIELDDLLCPLPGIE